MDTLIKKLRTENVFLSINGEHLEVHFDGEELSSELIQDLRDNKQALIQYIKDNQLTNDYINIEPLPEQDAYLLSSSQKRSWILSQLGGNAAYNMTVTLVFDGKLQRKTLEAAFEALIERHEILRTVFKEGEEEVMQYILPMEKHRFRMAYWDFRMDPEKKEKTDILVQKATTASFDLEQGPLFGVNLIQLAAEKHVITLVMHHIIGDDWSTSVFVKELMLLYNAFVAAQPNPLPPLKFNYKDYAAWQRAALDKKHRGQHQAYWLEKFAGTIPVLDLPTDKPRPSVRTYEGGELETWIPKALAQDFKKLVEGAGGTFFMGLLSLVKALLYLYSRQKDIVVGSVTAGRVHADLENQIGFYVNTLAFRTQFSEEDSYLELLAKVRTVTLETFEHQVYPFDELVNDLKLERNLGRNPLFDAFVIMHNNQDIQKPGETDNLTGIEVSLYGEETTVVSWFDVLFDFLEVDGAIRVNLGYNTDIFSKATAIQLGKHFEQLMRAVTEAPDRSINELNYLSSSERKKMLEEFNDTATTIPENQFVLDLLRRQVAAQPDALAISFEDENLSYADLEEKSNQLAHYLLEQAIPRNALIAVCMHRSIDLLVTLWGILKSGNTYVPIDPNYPTERILYILEDAKVEFVLCDAATTEMVSSISETQTIRAVEKIWGAMSSVNKTAPAITIDADQLAYIIYTSGSTGKPKGVMITHGNLRAFLHWALAEFKPYDFEVVFAGTSVCFDLSIFEIFFTASIGKRIRLLENGLAAADYLETEKSILLNTVPSVMKALLEQAVDLTQVKAINLAGEPIPSFVRDQLDVKRITVRNLYGPSEDTTYSTVYHLKAKEPILIGKPIANTAVYIVDEQLNLLPRGAKGELCLSGAGVAKGYLHRPTLTAQRFIDHPFDPKSKYKLYRTGDLARWLPDGQLDFLGRIDAQVKIRGYRIELGEIETVLQASPMIKEAVVLAKEDAQANKRLIAYLVPTSEYDKSKLQSFLKAKLPAYMLPSLFVNIEKLPLTPNGKVDKAALPDPTGSELSTQAYVAPRTALESELVETWQQLLRLEKIGIHDNFFELGGDSIISIQLVSRINRKGFQLVPIDLFENQTVADLAAFMISNQSNQIIAEQGVLTGSLTLLPIQQWFLEQEATSYHHFNQTVLLSIDKTISSFQLGEVFTAVLAHHDMLRARFSKTEDGWTQTYGEPEENSLIVADLSTINDQEAGALSAAIEATGNQHQASLSLSKGEVIRMVLIKTPSATSKNRLLLTAHHLVIDGVSWRILLEDIDRSLQTLVDTKTLSLGEKTSSYRQWGTALAAYSTNPRMEAQMPFWEKAAKAQSTLPVDYDSKRKITRASLKHHISQLAVRDTTALLSKAQKAYQLEINDLLLAGLLKTLLDWSSKARVTIGLEGHGREHLFAGMNTSNTIGWFTTLFPVVFTAPEKDTLADFIKSVKEALRAIPDKGMAYGMLRYLHPDSAIRERLATCDWEVIFNYLGQFDNLLDGANYLGVATESAGKQADDNLPFDAKFEINASVAAGKLSVNWTYSSEVYAAETVADLAAKYLANLKLIIEHCESQKLTQPTPTDFGLAPEVSYQALDQFLAKHKNDGLAPIVDMARLSPLQQGMLFHHLYDAKDTAYLEQFIFHIGNGFSLPAFKATWEYLMAQYSVLRTAIFGEALDIPVQCVYEKLALPIEVLDFSTFPPEEIETKWETFVSEERAKGIDFEQAPLMSIRLVKTGAEQYRMLWLFHHILLDGWSLAILTETFLTTYEAFYQGASLAQVKQQFNRKPDNYLAYIHYLSRQDKFAEETFWKSYLAGFLQPSLLPFLDAGMDRNKGGEQQEMKLVFSTALTTKIQKYAQKNHLTVNTLVQGVWAFLLSKYTGKEEVVYGVTVSGRPESLSGVEEKIGLFINTIPLRVKCPANQNVATILTELQQEHATARMYQYTALTDIQRWNAITGDLFDSLIAFENYPLGEVVGKEWALKFTHFELKEKTNYLLSLTVSLAENLNVKFGYNVDLLQTDLVAEIKHHFELVLGQIIAADELNLANINLLSPDKASLILETFNQTQNTYPEDKTIAHLFQEQVHLHSDKTALIFESEKMSYRALDEQSNQLAAYLIAQGVIPQEKVGVLARRGFEMIISVLAILKCRAIYVPLNMDYPEARLAYMLKDAAVDRIICGENTVWENCGLSQANYQRILPQESATYPVTPIKFTTAASPKALSAYVMYTSGTTGQPKGIVVSHRNIIKLSFDEGPIQVYPEDKVLQWSNLSFDGSSYEIFAALLRGASLCLITEATAQDPADLAKLIKREAVSVCFLTTALFNTFVDYDLQSLSSLRILLFGGERTAIAPVQKALNMLGTDRLINVYGPTETTTFATYYPIQNCKYDCIPIGRPLMNTQIYILNDQLAPVGIGLVGEICIAGDGVAQAYLGQEALTAEKFVENPFAAGKENKMYKTGDLAYWLPDGNIVFVGRRDAQVKVRGYRIELSEIETQLQALPMVNHAAVIVNQDTLGNKRLVAYLVTQNNFEQEEVTAALKAKLPSYMIPTLFVELTKLPLTENGKLDKKALPIPNFSELQSETYVAPRNTTEADLASVWQKALGIPQIGIHDNFFELGGDSIVSIQVVSRIKRMNYVAQTRDLFEYPTIAGLAQYIASKTAQEQNEAEQGVLTGSVKLLPIQHWFLAKAYASRDHFNQDYLFEISKAILPEQLDTALKAIVKQHDALRLQYHQTATGWEQSYGTYEPNLEILDCSTCSPSNLNETITQHCQQAQESLSLERGELIRCVLLKLPVEAENNRLLITVHHLAIDGVSWRILLDQLEVAITASQSGNKINLGPKSSSYRQWANHLATQSTEERILSELSYWESVGAAYQELPLATGVGDTLTAEMEICSASLNDPLTQALLQKVNFAYHTEIDDLLLSALALTVSRWTAHEKVVIGMEGHGRDFLGTSLDVTNTIGWFTNLYPVALSVPPEDSIAKLIKSIKEQRRAIPNKGIGYGLLRYLNPDVAWQESIAAINWDIVFNYLGQLDHIINESNWLKPAEEDRGTAVGTGFNFNKLEINGFIAAGKLTMTWRYRNTDFKKEVIQTLANQFVENLTKIIHHCTAQTKSVRTASDFGLAPEVDTVSLDAFLNTEMNGTPRRDQITSLYRLSPLQEGMFFLHTFDPTRDVYVDQLKVDLKNLNLDCFEKAWTKVLEQHSILRTAFFQEALAIPVQLVFQQAALPITVVEFPATNASDWELAWEAFLAKDLQAGFDFEQPPLMRMSLVKTLTGHHKMVWTFHHILLDGWSLPIVMKSFLNLYETLLQGNSIVAKPLVDEYEDYIKYIAASDRFVGMTFWKKYLQGFESPSYLPFVDQQLDRNKGGEMKEVFLNYPSDFTSKAKAYAQANQLTMNTLIQGVWGFLLSKYTNRQDIVFGVTVSGRPADLGNLEERVGLFINAIPLRIKFDENATIVDTLSLVQKEQTEAREFQYTAQTDIQRWLEFPSDLFDSLLIFENYPMGDLAQQDWSLEISNISMHDQNNYLFSLEVTVREEMRVKFGYNESVLPAAYAHRIQAHFDGVLQQIVQSQQTNFSELQLVSAPEKDLLLKEFVGASLSYPEHQSFVELFEAQVLRTPQKEAVVFETNSLTYQALNEKANQLAHYLQKQGLQKADLVCVCLERSMEMLISLLAIQKLAAAHVPLDPAYPKERISYILKDTDATMVICSQAQLPFIDAEKVTPLVTETFWKKLAEESNVQPIVERTPQDLSYLIYTSGSTGAPKGVMIEQQGLVSFLWAIQAELQMKPEESFLAISTYSFDIAYLEMYLPLVLGAKVILAPAEVKMDGQQLQALIAKTEPNYLQATPANWQLLLDSGWKNEEGVDILCGGEAIKEKLKNNLTSLGNHRVFNLYGPTETTIWSTIKKLTLDDPITVGKPIPNVEVYILTATNGTKSLSTNDLCPIGVVGEICIGGDGLARAYLNQPDLTQEKFVANPFSGTANARLYRTGDLGRWLPNGELECLGRVDDQVKIRGHRIELGEIESVLQQVPGVEQCVVLATEDTTATKILVAYLSTKGASDDEFQEAIRAHLKMKLPAYMMPSLIKAVESFPLTPNGKVDKKRLPQLPSKTLLSTTYVAARNELERKLIAIWKELLGIEQIGIHDNFFELGGHSLLVGRLVAELQKSLAISIPIKVIFEYSSVAKIYDYLRITKLIEEEDSATEFDTLEL